MTQVIWRVHPVYLINAEERQTADDPQTKPTDLDCKFAFRLLLSTSVIAIYRPTDGRKLGQKVTRFHKAQIRSKMRQYMGIILKLQRIAYHIGHRGRVFYCFHQSFASDFCHKSADYTMFLGSLGLCQWSFLLPECLLLSIILTQYMSI